MTPVGALVHDTTGITVTSPVHGGALILEDSNVQYIRIHMSI